MTKARFIHICPNKECSYTGPHTHGDGPRPDAVVVRPLPNTSYYHKDLGKTCYEFEVPEEGIFRFYEQAGTEALYRCRGEHDPTRLALTGENDPEEVPDGDLPGAWTKSDFLGGDPDERSYAQRDADRGDLGMPTLGLGVGSLISISPEIDTRAVFEGVRLTLTRGEATIDYGENGQVIPMGKQGNRVAEIILTALVNFLEKNSNYGEPDADDLGLKGQYADMHRKWKRLQRTMWFGDPWPETGESLEEVLMDLIGHIGLSIDFARQSGAREAGMA